MGELMASDAPVRSFCTFRLEQRLCGIEAAHVREISPYLPVTPVPQAPAAIRGLVNLRSRIYLALDLRPMLGLPPIECSAEGRLIILKPEIGKDLAVLVECGGDIVHVKAAQIEPSSTAANDSAGDGASPLIAAVCKLEQELMMVVDPTRFTDTVMKLIEAAPQK